MKKLETHVAYKRRTYDEKVAQVKEVQAKFPNASRTKIYEWTSVKPPTLKEMEAKGDIKLPTKRTSTSKNSPWMKGFLNGKTNG